ncbi:HAD-IA family hydrolase [Nocardia sp. XZ_19_369]|uniref:HAD-IA family hydrolase n=1 Tax=Nocardia sp. XZ_19_369 TaxID=2769487 RepID=UPI0027D3017E|nr:HAD-IA family hydrolase [Nocardia sp. XZ_19_369]
MNRPAILIDIGGVLVPDYLTAAAAEWSSRLGMSPSAFLAALFGGSDDQVLVGRISEESWWNIVGDRLAVGPDLVDTIRCDLASREAWDADLVAGLRSLHGLAKTAIVSNAWPQLRIRMANAGLLGIVDAIVLSCEVGYAKPDPRIYIAALQCVGAHPAEALFIDDTPGHVAIARSLGMAGHLHTSTSDTLARILEFLPPG